jgi:hypothetical protein
LASLFSNDAGPVARELEKLFTGSLARFQHDQVTQRRLSQVAAKLLPIVFPELSTKAQDIVELK